MYRTTIVIWLEYDPHYEWYRPHSCTLVLRVPCTFEWYRSRDARPRHTLAAAQSQGVAAASGRWRALTKDSFSH